MRKSLAAEEEEDEEENSRMLERPPGNMRRVSTHSKRLSKTPGEPLESPTSLERKRPFASAAEKSLLEVELSDVVSEDENEELKVPTPPIRSPPGHLSSLKVTTSSSATPDRLSSLNVAPPPPGRLATPDRDMLEVLSKISVSARRKMEKRVMPATPDHTSVDSWYYRSSEQEESEVFGRLRHGK